MAKNVYRITVHNIVHTLETVSTQQRINSERVREWNPIKKMDVSHLASETGKSQKKTNKQGESIYITFNNDYPKQMIRRNNYKWIQQNG